MKKKGSKRRKKNKNKDESKSEQEENRNPGLYLYYSTNIYENDNIHTNFTDKKSIFYCRDKYNNNLIFPKENQTEINEQFEIGFRARKSKNDYYELIYPIIKIPFSDYSEIDKLNNRLWYIFKPVDPKNNNENPNDDYNLLENDIIKFGSNAKFEIIKKHISNSSTQHNNQINNVNHKFGSIFDEFIPEMSNENDTCYFCKDRKLSKEISKVKLCKCDNYAHYECCKEEIKKRYETKKNEKGNVIRYTRKEFNFREREAPIPSEFFFDFDEETPKNSDYIILESLNEKNDIFVVKLDREEITIGRNINNDIIISEDPSISKEHCILSYNKSNGFLTIKDKSTYVTSVLIKRNAKIDKNKKLYFQNGNIFIKAEYYTGKIKTEEGKPKVDSSEKNNA